jgi:hypothetical protein
VFNMESQGVVSELSGNTTPDSTPDSPYDLNSPDHIPPAPESYPTQEIFANIGGRSKGSTKSAVLLLKQHRKDVITLCSKLFMAERKKAREGGYKVAASTLQRIGNEEAKKANLLFHCISQETILSWIKRGHPEAFNAQQVSPVHELEPITAEFCIWLARMDNPLTRETVMSLANDLIKESAFASKLSTFKEVWKLKNTETLGAAWYRGIMSHNATKLSRKGAISKTPSEAHG